MASAIHVSQSVLGECLEIVVKEEIVDWYGRPPTLPLLAGTVRRQLGTKNPVDPTTTNHLSSLD